MPKTLILFLLILLSGNSFPQKYLNFKSHDIDSILLILPGQIEEERINTLTNLSMSYCFYDKHELSRQYANEAMTLAKRLGYQEGIATAYRNFGHINLYQSDYPEALNNFFEALYVYEELGKKHTVADIYFDIACTHYFANNYDKTVEYGLISLNKFRERLEGGATVGGLRDTIKVLNGLYLTYWKMGIDPHKQFEYILNLHKAGQQINLGITELMFITIEVAINFFEIGETDSAIAYLDKALVYLEVNQDIKALKYRAFTWKGYIYRSLGEYDSALYYHEIAYNWYNKIGAFFWAMECAIDVGIEYQKKNDLNKAEKYYKHAEAIFKEIAQKNSWYRHDSLRNIVFWGFELFAPIPPGYKKEMTWKRGKWLFYRLYQIHREKNNTSEALNYHIAFSKAADTLNRLLRNHETVELQTKYETERKEEQIEFLSHENAFQEYKLKQSGYFLFGLGGLVLLVVILAIVLIRQNKLREQQKNLLLQQKLFRSQMNPHFIFNSLASIQNTIINEEPAKASKYLSRFSKLVRNILESTVEESIPLEEEINTIENYLELQKVRFPEKFNYSIELDEAIDPESVYIPPMLAQPFIENAIEHGIKHKDSKGHIRIRFKSDHNNIVFEVEDDGVGRARAQEILYQQNKDHRSLATAITLERIQVLNKKLKTKISLSIEDLKNEKGGAAGTKVVFELPVK